MAVAAAAASGRIVVVDASVIVAALVPGPARGWARGLLLGLADEAALLAPGGLVDAEVLNGLRKALLRGAVRDLSRALEAYLALPLHRVEPWPGLIRLAAEASRALSLSGQDALYLALALSLNAGLATLDTGLARAAERLLGPGRVEKPPRQGLGGSRGA